MRSHRYSKKAFIIDIKTAEVERLPDMHINRQAHGMVKVGDYVYCCAGLDGGYDILGTCERFNLQNKMWTKDVPPMETKKFSMTMMVMDKTWLYSFGGASLAF